MMECPVQDRKIFLRCFFLRVSKYRHPVCIIMYIASVILCLEDI